MKEGEKQVEKPCENEGKAIIVVLSKKGDKKYTIDEILYQDKLPQLEVQAKPVVASNPKPSSQFQLEQLFVYSEQLQNQSLTLDDGTKIIQPYLFKNKLRDYQLIGMNWLATLQQKRMNGILADEMGLGKTIQTIALLAYLAQDKGIWGPHLIIVPTSIILNWEIEFKKFCPAFKIMTYYGTMKERKNKRHGWSRINSFQVCITSYKIAL